MGGKGRGECIIERTTDSSCRWCEMTSAEQQLLEILHTKGSLDEVKRKRLLDAYLEVANPPKMTYKEFLDWAEDSHAEWVNGSVIYMSPASLKHQMIVDFLNRVISFFVEKHQLGIILSSPFQMKLADSGREPDLIFVSQKNLGRLKATFLDGPADLVIEVISPESTSRDRGEKYFEYEEAGIREYWLIDPLRSHAEFYQLNEIGRFNLVEEGNQGTYPSREINGFELELKWLWNPPRLVEAFASLGII